MKYSVMGYNEVNLADVEMYVMDTTSGNIGNVAALIKRMSLNITPRGVFQMDENEAYKMARSLLNSLADEGKVRVSWREVDKKVPVYVTME